MIRWTRPLLAALASIAAISAHASCTTTISPGADLTATVAGMTAGQTLCLNPGTYNPPSPGFPNDGNFAIGVGVTVIGLGATPAGVILQSTGNSGIYFVNYVGGKSANGATLQNVTIQGGQGGALINDFVGSTRLTDITLKDIVMTTVTGSSNGVQIINGDRINVDNVTVTAQAAGFYLQNVTTSLIMNSTVVSSRTAGALAMVSGTGNVIVNNTFGSPKVGATYPIPTGGVVFYNTTGNRFENNIVQGHQGDALDLQAIDFVVAAAATTDNYLGKNTVISTGFADGQPGGTGIWANCSANGTWLYGNESRGSVESGMSVFVSHSTMALANNLHDNGSTGYFLSGGTETAPFCTGGGGAFAIRPANNYVQSNAGYFNRGEEFVIRDADNTEIDRNHLSRHNGFGGTLRPECPTQYCQSSITVDSNGNPPPANVRFVANTSHDNIRGIEADNTGITGLQFAYNRMIQLDANAYNRYYATGATNWDGSAATGGNYWTLFTTAAGNPSSATPYGSAGAGNSHLGVFTNASNSTGLIVDRFPYQSEHMGHGGTITLFEPFANAFVAQGSRKTVRWDGPGCAYVDLLLDGTTALATAAPNTGYAIVTIPGGASVGTHNIAATCKTSAGGMIGTATGPTFNVSASTLQLLAPGRDDVFNAGSQILIAWKKAASIASVNVDLSTDGGQTFPTSLGAGLTGTFVRVALPVIAANAKAVIRVRSGATMDFTDGVFGIRGTSPGFSNVAAGRKLVMGQLERLEWASPASSRLVTITAQVGATLKTIATDLPDRGNFDWIVPDLGVGTLTLGITFKQTNGTVIGSTVTNTNGVTRDPNNITYNAPGSVGIGSSFGLNPTASSGLAVTLTSLTPSICTVSGGNVTGVAQGTCSITFNQAGNGTFAPATASTAFLVQADPPRLGNISTRMQVLTGGNVMIGGFIIGGSSNKTVAITATGPSLAPFGISNPLMNPTLQLVRSSDQVTLATNDDWQTDPNAGALQASGFAPADPHEPGLLVNLPPGAYTAIVSGVGNTTGTAVVGVFEVDHPEIPLVNISTRGFVQTGGDVMIGGFIIQGSGSQTVAITATGPSLAPFGISNYLANPSISVVRSSDQAVIASNDNWQSDPNAAALQASGFAPGDPVEAGLLLTLPPGAYTVIVQGVGGGTGVAVVGVFTTP